MAAEVKKGGISYTVRRDGEVIGTRKSKLHTANYHYRAAVLERPYEGGKYTPAHGWIVRSYHLTAEAAYKTAKGDTGLVVELLEAI